MTRALLTTLITVLLTSLNYAQETIPGTALEFDGTDDYVQVNSNVIPSSGNFTISVWAKTISVPLGYTEILSQKAGDSGEDFYIGKDTNGNIRAGDDWVDTGVPFPIDGNWHYYTVVKESLNTHLYLDGFHKASKNGSIVNPASSEFRIARQYGEIGEYFNGWVDEVRIWNTARTAQEIRENMHLTLAGSEAGLVSYWQLNEESGSNIYDAVSGYNGTMINMDDNDWVTSSAPIGGGASYTQIVGNSGTYDFTGTDVSMDVTTQNGIDTIVVSKLELAPNILPDCEDVFDSQYWIINSFGDGSFTTKLSFTTNEDLTAQDESTPNDIRLFNRNSSSDQIWSLLSYADSTNANDDNSIFTDTTGFSQFIIGREIEILATSFFPADGTTDVEADTTLLIKFDRNVTASNGNIYIKEAANDSILETISAANTQITGNIVTINPVNDFDYGISYYIQIDSNAFYDGDEHYFAGIYDNSSWNFTTLPFFNFISGIFGVEYSSVAWGDYDNDNDLDILITGYSGYGSVSRIYRNDSGVFYNINAGLIGINKGSVAWSDYDNDGDLDFLMMGNTSSSPISKIYRNDLSADGQTREFTDIGAELPGVYYSSVAWGDYDNDGDPDILFSGYTGSSFISRIYRNDLSVDGQTRIFTDINAGLPGGNFSAATWGDYDNDGDLDFLLTGSSYSTIYRNDLTDDGETRIFTGAATITGVLYASAAWGDYDNDGDLDILLTGYSNSTSMSEIYRNDLLTNGTERVFTDINAGLNGAYWGSAAWGDYDNDGDLDILITGSTGAGRISRIYRNDSGVFYNINAGLAAVSIASAAWGDYDTDGDLDIFLTGYTGSSDISRIYRNNSVVSNSVPVSPTGLSAVVSSDSITFSWNKATDNETPQDGLSYNIFLGNSEYDLSIKQSMADSTGYKLIPAIGNTCQSTSWTYQIPEVFLFPQVITANYWGVQTVDHTFAGSPFATNGFDIPISYLQIFSNSVMQSADFLTWEVQNGDYITSYQVQIDDDSTFSSCEINDTLEVSVSGSGSFYSAQLQRFTGSDSLVAGTKYYWRVKPNYTFGLQTVFTDSIPSFWFEYEPTIIEDGQEISLPKQFAMHQNYPNPFNPLTTIKYDLPKASNIKIELFDLLGRKVQTLVDGEKEAGYHKYIFNAGNLASGVYIYRIQAGQFSDIKKFLLLK